MIFFLHLYYKLKDVANEVMTMNNNANCNPKEGCLVFEESPDANLAIHDPSDINDPEPEPEPVSEDPVLVLVPVPDPDPVVPPMLLVEVSVDDF